MFFRKKNYNPNYESLLKNDGVNTFNKNITLLIISDTHGDLALDKEMYKKLQKDEYDLCCILGDIHDYDYDIILKYIPNDKIVSILGNHDRFNLLDNHGLINYNGRVIEINGVKLGFIQGSFKYKNEVFPSYTHEESINFLKNMKEVDILLSHDKPFVYDYNDPAHDGLKGITKYLYDKKVPINIHGHIHKSYLSNLNNGTQIKGVYGIEIVKIVDGRII